MTQFQKQIMSLQPGQVIEFDFWELGMNKVDHISEIPRIPGAALNLLIEEHRFATPTHQYGVLRIKRLEQELDDGRLTFVSADRRHLYRPDGQFWVQIQPVGRVRRNVDHPLLTAIDHPTASTVLVPGDLISTLTAAENSGSEQV